MIFYTESYLSDELTNQRGALPNMDYLKKYLSLLFFVGLGILSLRVMYFSNEKLGEVKRLHNAKLIQANCINDAKFEKASIRVNALDSNIIVLDTFIVQTECNNRDKVSALLNDNFDINYIEANQLIRAVAIWRNGELIYGPKEFIESKKSSGAFLLFVSILALVIWYFKWFAGPLNKKKEEALN